MLEVLRACTVICFAHELRIKTDSKNSQDTDLKISITLCIGSYGRKKAGKRKVKIFFFPFYQLFISISFHLISLAFSLLFVSCPSFYAEPARRLDFNINFHYFRQNISYKQGLRIFFQINHWNHCWYRQSDWLSSAIYSRIAPFFALNRIFPQPKRMFH